MKKEHLKTVILVLLVFSSIILTVNKWFSEKLWPDGYNFFSNLTAWFSFGSEAEEKTYYLSKENISNPSKIIVNNNELRSIYKHTSAEYNSMLSQVKDVLKGGLSEQNFEEGSGERWKEALKNASVYITYPVAYDFKTFSAVMDSPVNDFGISFMQEFIIAAGDNITGKPHLLIKDASNDKYADVTLGANSLVIDSLIKEYAVSSVGESPYSFELNFDKSNDTIEQKIIIEPQVVLSIGQVTQPSAAKINYFENISNDRALYNKFLKAFGYNTTNLRKNINIDNSIVFVENYSSIKMHSDGYLEYRSLDDTKGIPLGTSANSTFYDIFIDCIEFVNNVWDTACSDLNMDINLSSLNIDDQSSFKLTIDYYADGMEVVSRLPKTASHDKLNHAIEITVKNSKIVSYRQIVSGYSLNSDITECGSVIEALDILMANDSIKSDTITDLYLAYNQTEGADTCIPCWVAKTAENEIRIISNR